MLRRCHRNTRLKLDLWLSFISLAAASGDILARPAAAAGPPPARSTPQRAEPTGAPRGARDATRRHGAAYACPRVGWKRLDERFSTQVPTRRPVPRVLGARVVLRFPCPGDVQCASGYRCSARGARRVHVRCKLNRQLVRTHQYASNAPIGMHGVRSRARRCARFFCSGSRISREIV